MSEEVEQRECDVPSESEEGDIESCMEEPESSRELLERLRELEAENSALALANESQREAYERCLDEVANHVVQALLNQKDLREECIKLKMRVFDLERQNRTLTEFFHQKLHSQSGTGQQEPSVLHTEHNPEAPTKGADRLTAVQCEGQAKATGDCTPNGTADSRAPPTSMEALSPFFKKKAHILEVLRRMEETDPLKFHPYPGLSYYDFGQAVIPTDSVFVPSSVPVRQHKAPQPHCRHSCSDSDIHEYVNGEGALPEDHVPEHEGCRSCFVLSQKSLAGMLKCNHGHVAPHGEVSRLGWSEEQGASAQTTNSQAVFPTVDGTAQACHSPAHREDKRGTDSYYCSGLKDGSHNGPVNQELEVVPALGDAKDISLHDDSCVDEQFTFGGAVQCKKLQSEASNMTESTDHINLGDFQNSRIAAVVGKEEAYFEVAIEATSVKTGLHSDISNITGPEVMDSSEIEYCEHDTREQICGQLYFSSNETSLSKKVTVDSYLPPSAPDKNDTVQQPLVEKTKLALSPTSFGEVKPSPISSPSRLLKFLKIPSIGERATAANPLRLSPQLTRSSKIPCRNNNYEVQHSPVMARKATTTERDRQPTSSKDNSYPSTHSAPTSPPKPEDDCLPVSKDIGFTGHSASKANRGSNQAPSSQLHKAFQKVPHYENVSDIPTSCHMDCSPHCFEGNSTSHFFHYPQNEVCKEKQPKLDENVLSSHVKQPNSSAIVDQSCDFSPSDPDTDTESTDWYKLQDQHSLPASASPHRSQSSCNYSSVNDRQDRETANASGISDAVVSQDGPQKSDPPSIPKKHVTGKLQSDSSHHLFKERLAALGKLKSTEDLQVTLQPMDKKDVQYNAGKVVSSGSGEKSRTAERQCERNIAEHKQPKHTDSLDGKPYCKPGSHAVKPPAQSQPSEPGSKPATTSSATSKVELDTFAPKMYVAKAEGPKIKVNVSSPSPDSSQVLRNYVKCSANQNPPYSSKTVPSPQSSPTKVPSKSPSKPGQSASNPRPAKSVQEERVSQKPSPRAEDKSKLTAGKKKCCGHAESLPPAPPRPGEAIDERRLFVSAPQSAIEQKVMKGIEENVLKLQEQDRGHVAEVKQKASNGIASWFGLKKSKLPALSRKPEMSKLKLSMPSASKDAKTAARKKLEAESLNISKLMEKAEDLRRALEEERAYMNGVALDRTGRGHSCEVVMDQAQGQLSVMYRGVSSDNFIQQLLNRVDERDTTNLGVAPRRLSFDSKKSRPLFSHQRSEISHTKSREEMEKGTDLGKDVPSDEILADSINSQHFTGSGSSMRTLDSGIGTFPLPDYAGGAAVKSVPKVKAQGEQEFYVSQVKHGPVTKVPRKAHTLERELSSLEEVNPCTLYSSALEGKTSVMHLSSTIHKDVDDYGPDMQSPPAQNWTFPNLKAPAGPADVFLGVKEGAEQPNTQTPFRVRNVKAGGPPATHDGDPASLPLPPPAALSRRGKTQTPVTQEMGKDGGLELIKERPDDILSPSRPQALETPESLSDSLYDSLSSCGSQG